MNKKQITEMIKEFRKQPEKFQIMKEEDQDSDLEIGNLGQI